MMNLLAERLPDLGEQSRRSLLNAAAVNAYHAQQEFPVVKLLVCDDAEQLKRVTEEAGFPRLLGQILFGGTRRQIFPTSD